jgi:hypothetical protein
MIPAIEWVQTNAIDRKATGIDCVGVRSSEFRHIGT